jgi:phosphoribosylamine--glycine ligase
VGIPQAEAIGALVFHAGTDVESNRDVVTNGGRVLTVVGRGSELATARDQAERAANEIRWRGAQRRTDIALNAPPIDPYLWLIRTGAAS